MTDETPDLGRLPTLRKRLAELRSGIVRQILAYGAGTVLGAASLWLCFAFLADWGLRVPHGLRVFHGFVLLFVIALFAWRDLFRPLARIPGPEGLTLLFERAHPELRELLISAVQFQRAPAAGDPELVAGVVARAEVRAAELHPRAVIDPEAPRARFLLGIGATLSLALLAWQNPLHARIFLERLLGSTVAWPQRTHLTLDLPGLSADSLVERSEARWRLRLARGTDLAVLVTAEGQVPDEVTVHFDGGRDQVLNPSGENVFRTLLRSCQEDLSFHVTGGDDVDELPRVEIEILEPPDVAGIAIAVRPPAYSTLPETLVFNQDVDVLRGSELTVHVLPEPADAVGLVRLLPDDVTRSLTPAPFPSENGGEPVPGVSFALTADKTIGFRIELTDRNGLTNPEPGLFRVRVLEDRPPELSVLAPSRGEFETVRGGALPLRVRAEDDFGLVALGWRVTSGVADGALVASGELTPQPLPTRATGVRAAALGSARLEVQSLGTAEAPVDVDARFELEFFARDQRAPEANEGRSPPIRVRVVTPEELLRRLQDRLAQARMDAVRLSEEQRAKRARIDEQLDALESDGTLASGESMTLSAALAGERRVLADAQNLARNLASAAEDVLYARLDEKAAGLLEYYDASVTASADARFQGAPWRALARESAGGSLPSEGFAANLVALVGLALEISEDHATAAVAALQAAENSNGAVQVADNLEAASEAAGRVLERTEALLAALAEWDNFQNVLVQARDLLNRQKELRDRTQQFATEK